MSWLAPVDTPSSATNNTSPLTSASDPSNQVSNPPSNKSIGKPKRVHQIISLKPEHYEDYKKCHAEVWPEVMEQIKRVGIEDYSISYDPQTSLLFATYKYTGTNYEADMALSRAHEPTRKWWAMTDGYQKSLNAGAVSSALAGTVDNKGNKVEGWWRECEEVFYLA